MNFPSKPYSQKATLIVKNIRTLHTCDGKGTVFENGYIACHHERILETGTGSWTPLADSATRIIDAGGMIVVPAFIETGLVLPQHPAYHTGLRHQQDKLHELQRNGILTVLCTTGEIQYRSLKQDVFRARKQKYPAVGYGQPVPAGKFVLTVNGKGNLSSLQPAAFHARQVDGIDSESLLFSMTCWPAESEGLRDRGSLEPGKLADFLILRVPDLDSFFEHADNARIERMVKSGIPVWPSLMRC